ncbi:hypothetical protein KI387_035946, partial [Taxus chinensis]
SGDSEGNIDLDELHVGYSPGKDGSEGSPVLLTWAERLVGNELYKEDFVGLNPIKDKRGLSLQVPK